MENAADCRQSDSVGFIWQNEAALHHTHAPHPPTKKKVTDQWRSKGSQKIHIDTNVYYWYRYLPLKRNWSHWDGSGHHIQTASGRHDPKQNEVKWKNTPDETNRDDSPQTINLQLVPRVISNHCLHTSAYNHILHKPTLTCKMFASLPKSSCFGANVFDKFTAGFPCGTLKSGLPFPRGLPPWPLPLPLPLPPPLERPDGRGWLLPGECNCPCWRTSSCLEYAAVISSCKLLGSASRQLGSSCNKIIGHLQMALSKSPQKAMGNDLLLVPWISSQQSVQLSM